ncbi:MAG: PP2C family protein-serine/threonine phosphatase [Spirochaetes bacterium]|nr:PP2C family protein-serine/threonine phosphatase [Spirochaetota bacterium]
MTISFNHTRPRRIRSPHRTGIVLIAAVIGLAAAGCSRGVPEHRAVGGRITVSRWTADGSGLVRPESLEGQWLFKRGDDPSYRRALLDDDGWETIEVPLNWFRLPPGRRHHGYAWYRLHIVMPAMPPSQVAGIELGWIDDADAAYWNGQRIGRTGTFPGERGRGRGYHSYDRTRIYAIPGHLIRPGEDNVLALRVHSMDYDTAGIYMGDQRIGSYRSLVDRFHLTENVLIMLGALYLIVGFYHAFLFYKRPRTFENLFFSLFTVAVGFVTFFRSQTKYFLLDDFTVLKFAEYCTEVVLLGLFVHFLVFYFEEKLYNRATVAIDALIAGCLLYLSVSYPNVTMYFYLSDYFTYWLYIATIAYCSWYLFRFRKRSEARLMLAGFAIVAVTIMIDLLTGMMDVSIPWIGQYGFFAFVLAVAGALGDRFVNLYNEAVRATKERSELIAIQQELRIARQIQQSILPERTPRIPGLTVTARYLPMGAVGGDFYDFQVIGDGQGLGVLVADVTGHGVPASLIASMMKVAFTFQRDLLAEPGLLMNNLNVMFHEKVRDNYITAGYLIIDRGRMRLTHASAGHLPVLHLDRSGREISELKPKGVLLGMDPGVRYTTQSCGIAPGSRIIIFTDGIIEAASAHGELFGEARFRDIVLATADLGPEEFADRVILAVNEFIPAGHEPQDDITLVVIDVE